MKQLYIYIKCFGDKNDLFEHFMFYEERNEY